MSDSSTTIDLPDASASSGVVLLGSEGGGDVPGGDALAGCAVEMQRAKQLPLDLYFMLDTSGSMNDLVANTRSKWSSVVAAVSAFATDPASAGVGAGVQYFPRLPPGVPDACGADLDCGLGGLCLTGFCQDASACHADADCAQGPCLPEALCSLDQNVLCPNIGGSCQTDPNGFSLGTCVGAPPRCQNDDCVSADYAAPAVGIAALPGIASAITASLQAHRPQGQTPTAPALQGAIDGARAYASAHPGHTAVAVLATDGLPNEIADPQTGQCASPSQGGTNAAVTNVAAAGLVGTPSIKTFAIGVFTPDDVTSGTATLNELARAGGTGQPFIVQTAAATSVEHQFTAALNAIRGQSLPCQYELPTASSGPVDFNKLNARYVNGAGMVTALDYVESAARCGSLGGWYYDADPAAGATPKALDVCPSTCSILRGDPNGEIDIVLGCQTEAAPH